MINILLKLYAFYQCTKVGRLETPVHRLQTPDWHTAYKRGKSGLLAKSTTLCVQGNQCNLSFT